MRQKTLRPGDVVVALQVALTPDASLAALAERSGRSLGEVHNALARLRSAGLMDPERRRVEREPLMQFIRWGVPYAFPPVIGGTTVGVATGTLDTLADGTMATPASVEFVWASAEGTARGVVLEPLHPRVPDIAGRNGPLYGLLAAVDLIRVGGAREREAASAWIEQQLAAETQRG